MGIEQEGKLGGLGGLTGGDSLDGGLVDGGLGGSQRAAGLGHQLLGDLHGLAIDGVVLSLGSGGLGGLLRGLGLGNLLLNAVDLGGLDGLLGLSGGGVQGSVALHEPIQEAQIISLLSGDHLGEHDQLLGLGGADDSGGAGAAVGAGNDAQTHLGEGQGSAGTAHAEVAGKGHLAAAAEGEAAHSSDGGDGQGLQNVVDLDGQTAELAGVAGIGLGHLLDVSAGGKGTLGTGHDQHPDGGISLHEVDGVHDVAVDLAVQRVEGFGTVELDGGDAALHRVNDVGELHWYQTPFLFFIKMEERF